LWKEGRKKERNFLLKIEWLAFIFGSLSSPPPPHPPLYAMGPILISLEVSMIKLVSNLVIIISIKLNKMLTPAHKDGKIK
jgi:hypothetical protein